MKKILFFCLMLTSLACTTQTTDHLLNLKDAFGIDKGTLVINEQGSNIGVVTEIISDEYGTRQFIEIEESYLKYPAASFRTGFDKKGNRAIVAFYEE